MKITKKIWPILRRTCADIYYIWRKEYKMVFSDAGVLVFFFLLTLAYPLLYAAIYNPEVVRDVPIVVVDDNRSALSRQLVRNLDASPNVKVISYCANIAEARQMMMKTECYGILHIPQDFNTDIVRGTQGVVEFYSDMSLLINYKNFLMALTDVTMDLGGELRAIADRYCEQPYSLCFDNDVQSRVGICLVSHPGGVGSRIATEYHTRSGNAGRRHQRG